MGRLTQKTPYVASPRKRKETMKVIQKIPRYVSRSMIGLAIFFALYTVLGFFVLPPVLKAIVSKKLSENLHRKARIEKIELNPYHLSLTVKGLAINDRDNAKNFVSFDNLYLNVQWLSLFKLAMIVQEVRLEGPDIRIVRKDATTYNFSDLVGKEEKPEGEPPEPMRFSVSNIQISNAHLELSDIPKQKKHEIKDINITIPFISNFPYLADIFVQPSFKATINDTPVSFEGKTRPFTEAHETYFDINMKDVNIPHYLSYIPFERNFELLSGYLDINVKISYSIGKDERPSLKVKGDLALKEAVLEDGKGGGLLQLPRMDISIAQSRLFSNEIHLAKILLHSPQINIKIDKTGKTNISRLVPAEQREEKGPPAASKKPFAIRIDNIHLSDGTVSFSDFSLRKPFQTSLDPLELSVHHFTNVAGEKATYALSLRTESGEILDLSGVFSLSPLFSKGSVGLKAVPIKKYAPYYRDYILFEIKDSNLELHADYLYEQGKEKPIIRLSDLKTSISDVQLGKEDKEKDFLSLSSFSLEGAHIDLTKREIDIGKISSQKGVLELKRSKDGVINLSTLLPVQPASDRKAGQVTEKKDKGGLGITIREFLMDDLSVNFEDQAPSEVVKMTVNRIKLAAKNISTKKGQKGDFSFSFYLDKHGQFSSEGAFSINPLVADLDLDIKEIEIRPFQSYFTDKIKIMVTDGRISMAGRVSLVDAGDEGFKGAYRGEASLMDLSTMSKPKGEDLLFWESLRLHDIDLKYNPTTLNIGEVELADFYSKVIHNPDGAFNFQHIVQDKQDKGKAKMRTPSTVSKDKGPVKRDRKKHKEPFSIGKVVLRHGHIVFLDASIKPHYSTSLFDLGGEISPVTLEKDKTIDIALKGKLDKHGPLEIRGRMKPLGEDLFLDLLLNLKALDLTPLSPYCGKYAGRTIEKGKLYLELKYHIDGKKLDAKNKVFLDQFTLGDTVESSEATDLPVGFALSLLKNHKGEIDLDLPVTGNLDDPKFSLGGIILKAIKNLVMKAVTSPFSLVGAIVGGGEELSYVEFDYGSDEPSAGNSKKLDALVKVLTERPSLRLEIEAHIDIEKDREGLKKRRFNKTIKTQKLKKMLKKGLPIGSVDQVNIEAREYERYLRMAYKAGRFAKPKNRLGLQKKLPRAEMEKLILASIHITDDDLRLLMYKRIEKIKDTILASESIGPERLFVIEPKLFTAEKREDVRNCRVDFRLK
jgi:uncharacterized protein involved in outer membrane biogenesis